MFQTGVGDRSSLINALLIRRLIIPSKKLRLDRRGKMAVELFDSGAQRVLFCWGKFRQQFFDVLEALLQKAFDHLTGTAGELDRTAALIAGIVTAEDVTVALQPGEQTGHRCTGYSRGGGDLRGGDLALRVVLQQEQH